MGELWQQLKDVFLNLFNTPALMEALGRPGMTLAAFIALNVVVFTETGLLIGFFLPGDSLLVVSGLVCAHTGWPLALLVSTLCLAAIFGDSAGYAIGRRAGPAIYNREETRFFRKSHLLAAHEFYEKHGGITIVLARFMPLVRTFAPVVAGVACMSYRRFVLFNIIGGVGWVSSMILIGYFLETVIDPPLQTIFGPAFTIRNYIEWLVIIIVLISISPMAIAWLRTRRNRSTAANRMELVTNR
jgi:membrane-associated protein